MGAPATLVYCFNQHSNSYGSFGFRKMSYFENRMVSKSDNYLVQIINKIVLIFYRNSYVFVTLNRIPKSIVYQ